MKSEDISIVAKLTFFSHSCAHNCVQHLKVTNLLSHRKQKPTKLRWILSLFCIVIMHYMCVFTFKMQTRRSPRPREYPLRSEKTMQTCNNQDCQVTALLQAKQENLDGSGSCSVGSRNNWLTLKVLSFYRTLQKGAPVFLFMPHPFGVYWSFE